MNRNVIIGIVAVTVFMAALAPAVHGATTADSQLTQSITAGAISTSVRDASGVIVPSPSFGMSAATVSTGMQTVTGTYGSDSQRLTVDNPGASATGFTLAVAVTGTATTKWESGANNYAFNGATAANGQLTINPAAATLVATAGTTTGVIKGAQATFASGTNTPIELLNAGSTSDDIWNGYITGVGLSQTIPASTPAGSYAISLTQTATAQ